MEGAVREGHKAFASAHRSDEERQVYITASRHASFAISKTKANAWLETCSSLSPESVYFILHAVASYPSSPFSTNFHNCSSPR